MMVIMIMKIRMGNGYHGEIGKYFFFVQGLKG